MIENKAAQALRSYMGSVNESQGSFARRLGVTQGQVSHWLAGRTRITAERAIQIEQATAGAVTRHELRPDLYPRDSAQATSHAA